MCARSAATIAAVAMVAAACGRTEGSPAPVPPVSPVAAQAAEAVRVATDAGALAAAWPESVRNEQWDAAWRELEALPPAEKARPEVRYVRARVALERGEAAAALPLLEGLEAALPLLADDVARRRAQAQLAVGPFEAAGEWFEAHATPADQLEAARAFERAHDARRARAAADRVVASGRRTRAQEAEARAIRVRLAESPGDVERADARWLATTGADVAAGDTLALVARVDPAHPLTARELMARAHALGEAGRTDDALRAIDLAASAPGADRVAPLERARARGAALFRAHGRSAEAAKVLAGCAEAGGPHAAEDAFHAARALSRADRDEEAVRGYQQVERRFPKSPWAEAAAFFAPYLRMLHGQWRDCASGFDAYLRAHAGGEHDRAARRDGSLCKLLAGDVKEARAGFERLSEGEPAAGVFGARMADMAALAALRDGDRSHAVALWTDVARSRPLSWPALVARARLAETGAPVPPAIEAASGDEDGGAERPSEPLVVSLPAPADVLHALGLDSDAEDALHEREGAVAGGAGSRASEALCEAYGELGRARRRYRLAQTLPAALLSAAPTAATRWAWECAFPSPYAPVVRAAESSEALPTGLLWAVMRQESGFDPDAVSPARAVGLMQLMPDTARAVVREGAGVGEPALEARLTSPPYAIAVGARLLHELLDRFHGDVPLAVAAYNGGADPIERWLARAPGMQIDTFVERIPYDETREYVVRVMGNLARYGYLARGEQGVPRLRLDLRGLSPRAP